MHQQLHALRVRIVVEHLDVEIRIGGHEVKHVALPQVGPVFPTNVPTFNQYLVEAVLGSKVNIALHLLVVGTMTTIRLHLVPVDLVELNAGILIGIVP